MNEEERALIGYRMDRAREALNEAQLLLDHDHTHTSVNRLYYACFYAVSALLINKGFSTSRHGHLRSVFHREFVKDGSIPTVMGKHFDKLFQNRQKSDYSDYARSGFDRRSTADTRITHQGRIGPPERVVSLVSFQGAKS
ncbi:MAG: HEPN domain-containing protein [Planctomycetes bacterium]|nr:HEPN domain-containing protein [Planctomycetota bacterium]